MLPLLVLAAVALALVRLSARLGARAVYDYPVWAYRVWLAVRAWLVTVASRR